MLLFVGIHSLRDQAEYGNRAHEEDCIIELNDQISDPYLKNNRTPDESYMEREIVCD